jgi:hypothetical protein
MFLELHKQNINAYTFLNEYLLLWEGYSNALVTTSSNLEVFEKAVNVLYESTYPTQ